MCGRFALTTPPDVIARWYELMHRLEFAPRYNIAPTQPIVAVRRDKEGKREGALLHWGLIPFWAKDPTIGAKMINARAESVADKPAYRQAIRKRRCLIPADGFFEWKKTGSKKQPYYISAADGNPLTFAGLWETWHDKQNDDRIESCTIITTDPNDTLKELHNRMPVVLPRDAWDQWLDVEHVDAEQAAKLLEPAPNDGWSVYPVSRRVNSPANDDASILDAVEQADEEQSQPMRKSKSQQSNTSDTRQQSLFE